MSQPTWTIIQHPKGADSHGYIIIERRNGRRASQIGSNHSAVEHCITRLRQRWKLLGIDEPHGMANLTVLLEQICEPETYRGLLR